MLIRPPIASAEEIQLFAEKFQATIHVISLRKPTLELSTGALAELKVEL